MDPTPAADLPRLAATTRPAYLMPVGHHHPNGPNMRANVQRYVPLLHMHIDLKPHTQNPPHTRTRSALAVRLEGEMFMI